MNSTRNDHARTTSTKKLNGVLRTMTMLVFLLAATISAAYSQDSIAIRKRQDAQEKARSLAKQLVSGVLEIQIRQLQENGLNELPIYQDIVGMRGNLDRMVEKDMETVVELLVKAQAGADNERLAAFTQARDKTRDVVVQLMAERQKLYRRMQIARMAAEVRELISMQSGVRKVTGGLGELPLRDRERQSLSNIEDQRDVKALYFRLVDTLDDISGWGGQSGVAAIDGLRLLDVASVPDHLNQAHDRIVSAEFKQSVESQTSVIKGLEALLERIEKARGLVQSDRAAAMKMVTELMQEQEELRDQTREEETAKTQDEAFVEKQSEINEKLAALSDELERFESTEALIEQAQESANDAESELFEGKKDDAVLDQSNVIGSLAQIAEQLASESAAESTDKSAAELAEDVKKLEKLEEELGSLAKQQDEVTKTTEKDADAAEEKQQKVAEGLDEATKDEDVSPVIESAIAEAAAEASKSKAEIEELKRNADAANQEEAKEASQETKKAIDRAKAAVKAELADTKRKQLAVEVAEAARAAEVLERTAAEQKAIATEIAQADDSEDSKSANPKNQDGEKTDDPKSTSAKNQDDQESSDPKSTSSKKENDEDSSSSKSDEDDAPSLQERQAAVADVTSKVQEGVKGASPNADKQLAAAKKSMQEVADKLATDKTDATANKDRDAAAMSAEDAAEKLEQAAAALRKQQGESARQLAELAAEQLEQVAGARESIEGELTKPKPSATESLAKLNAAAEKVERAQVEQMKAAGKEQAAEAQDVANEVNKLGDEQAGADSAAEDLAKGRANSPLEASAQQQAIAKAAEKLANQSSGETAEALKDAAQAAKEAARQTFAGNEKKADAARQATRDSLAKAKEASAADVAEAAKKPADKPNMRAQQRVADLAEEAGELAVDSAPQTGQQLADAKQNADDAADAIANMDDATTGESQAKTAAALDKAAEQLADAKAKAEAAAKGELTQEAQNLEQLANDTAEVDPAAAVALDRAQQAADEASQPSAAPASKTPAAQKQVERGLEQAMANLATKEARIHRDLDIAQTLADLAGELQSSRDEIARQAAALEANDQQPGEMDMQAAADAANKLDAATQEFADAQRATGEGAAEISEQENIANPDLKEALDAASELAQGDAPPEPSASQDGEMGSGENAQQASQSSPTGEQPPSNALGQGAVPNSPEVTAQQIAGPEAMQAAAQAQAQANAAAQTQAQQPNSSQQASQQSAQQASQAQAASQSSSTAQSTESSEAQPEDGALALQRTGQGDSRMKTEEHDADAAARRFGKEPWFAKLPESLRKAILSKTRRRAPRGYEERLKRYFESGD